MALSQMEYDDPNIIEVDQTTGKTITLNYSAIIGYANAANSPCVCCPLPFVAKNTSYSVSITKFAIDGVGNATSPTALVKNTNSLTIKGTATMAYNHLFGCAVTVTITFA